MLAPPQGPPVEIKGCFFYLLLNKTYPLYRIRRPLCLTWGGGAREAWSIDCLACVPARSSESTTASLASPCMFPRKRSSAMSTYAGPSMHVHLCCYCLFLCCVSAMSTYYDAPSMSSGTLEWLVAHGAAQSRYVNPTNACHPTHPALFLAGSKVPNGSGSADQVGTRWAWILLWFCRFACVLIGDAGGCDVPLEWLVPHGAAQSRYVNPTNACHPTHPALFLAGSKVPNGSGSADQVGTRWAWILLGFCRFACVLTGDAGGCDVPLEWLVAHGAAQSRYVNPTNACHPTHPALFLAGSKVPNGSGSADQVGTRWAWILLRFCRFACVLTGDAGGCDVPLEWLVAHGAAQSRYVNPTNACHPTHPALFLAGSKVPNGSGSADQVGTRWAWILLGFCRFACVLIGDAGGCDVPLEWLVPHGAAQSRYVNPTNACHPTHPALFLAGSKVPNGSGSADQVGTRWAWILLGFCRFACVLTGDAGGCDVPLEWLVAHGAAQSRYVNPTNACHPTHPALFLAGSKVPNGSGSADQVGTRWAWILLGFCRFACVLTGDAGGCDVPLEWLVAHGAAQSRYVNPTNACHPTHPALFLAGSKVPNGSGSADQVGTRWAWILLGFCRFACVLTGDAGGCDVPLEWLVLTVLPRAVTSTQPMPATSPIQLCF